MLRLRPISLRDANEYVRQHHRHHKPVAGHKFSIGCEADGELGALGHTANDIAALAGIRAGTQVQAAICIFAQTKTAGMAAETKRRMPSST